MVIIDNKAIGKRIRQEREKLGLSREEFAEIIGLSDYYVGQLERGERQMSLPTLVNIVICLHVSLDYLVFGNVKYCNDSIDDYSLVYETNDRSLDEMYMLLKKCTPNEKKLFLKLIKTIIPYMSKK